MRQLLKSFRTIDYIFMLISATLIVAQVYFDLKMPDYTARLTSSVSTGVVDMDVVWTNGGYMLLCALASLACSILCGLFVARIGGSFSKNTRERIFSKVLSFSSKEMSDFSTPSLITRTINDVGHINRFITMGLQMLIKAPVLAVWSIMKISATSMEWTLATIICVAIIVIFVVIIVSLCIPRFRKVQALTDNLNNAMRENLSGVRVVRAFNAEEYQEKKFYEANDKLTSNQLFTAKATGLLSPVLTMLMNGLTLAIYWIGVGFINSIVISPSSTPEEIASLVAERGVVIGQMTAFTQYALQVVMAFMMLIMIFIFLPRVIVSSKRVKEVLSKTPSIVDGNISATSSIDNTPSIEFRNVSFKFPDGAENALSDISFAIYKGETVAIIGATGSGKSTMLDLIARNYDASEGDILVDGVNVREYSLEYLSTKLSVAWQKATLFHGNIKDNITYGSDKIDEEKVLKALDIAEADFVKDLHDGIEYPVSQGGTNFSGGQKQRLSIARAIYKDAGIMIFDDSFSALDYKTDMRLRRNIKKNMKNKTIVIVAQRIGTIKNCDKIIVMDNGRIVGVGTHDALLKTCPIYEEIALSQLSKEEL